MTLKKPLISHDISAINYRSRFFFNDVISIEMKKKICAAILSDETDDDEDEEKKKEKKKW